MGEKAQVTVTVDKKFLYKLSEIAQEAGRIILTYYQKKDVRIESKSDESPVTEADFAASEYIVSTLRKVFPDIPSLSEESPESVFNQRLGWSEYFLIDPLDGTKEFINRNGEFTVNIAFIKDNVPHAGVIDVPVYKETYYGSRTESYVSRNGMEFKLPLEYYEEGRVRVVSTKSHKNAATDEYIENLKTRFKKVESLSFGSSLKICKVAEGVADLNPRLGRGTKEWDIAAGHAILRGAGGEIVELGTRIPVSYNKESLFNPEYEAKRKELYQSLDC